MSSKSICFLSPHSIGPDQMLEDKRASASLMIIHTHCRRW